MKKYIFLFSLLFLPLSTNGQMQNNPAAFIPREWVGEYQYSTSERGNNEYTDVTEYVLTIGSTGEGTDCHFVVQGPQLSNADYECRSSLSANKLTFYFVRSLEPEGDGQVKRMKTGFIIGSLVKAVVRGKNRYRLEAGRYQFDMVITKTHPVYFKKTK